MPPSKRWIERRWTDDTGSASLEFVTVGLILMLPLVYLVLAVSAIQGGALAVEGAARQAARVFVESPTERDARVAADRAVRFALADHGVADDTVSVVIACAEQPCLTRRAFVTVSVELVVPLPLVPPVIVGDFPLAVPLHATATQQVSRFWGAG